MAARGWRAGVGARLVSGPGEHRGGPASVHPSATALLGPVSGAPGFFSSISLPRPRPRHPKTPAGVFGPLGDDSTRARHPGGGAGGPPVVQSEPQAPGSPCPLVSPGTLPAPSSPLQGRQEQDEAGRWGTGRFLVGSVRGQDRAGSQGQRCCVGAEVHGDPRTGTPKWGGGGWAAGGDWGAVTVPSQWGRILSHVCMSSVTLHTPSPCALRLRAPSVSVRTSSRPPVATEDNPGDKARRGDP